MSIPGAIPDLRRDGTCRFEGDDALCEKPALVCLQPPQRMQVDQGAQHIGQRGGTLHNHIKCSAKDTLTPSRVFRRNEAKLIFICTGHQQEQRLL